MENILMLLTPKNDLVYLNSTMTIRQGLEKFRVHGFTAIPVLNEDGTYYGVVSEGDFLWSIMNDNVVTVQELESTKIKNIIRKKIPSCKVDAKFKELVNLITQYNFVPIVDDRNILMGIITRKSVINHLVELSN